MTPLAAWLLGTAAVIAFAWASASAHRLLYPRVPPLSETPHAAFIVHQVPAPGGGTWPVRVLSPAVPRGRLLLCHGYFASYRQVLDIGDGLRQHGYEVILLELRGHGDRPGPCTLGVRETEDALATLAWANGRAPLPLGVLGFSMGGAIACQAALRFPGVQAAVLDSPYARLYPVLARAIWTHYRLPGPAAWLTWWGAHAWLRRRLARVDPVEAAPRLRQPLLLIQGGQDRRIAPGVSERLYDAWAGPKTRWTEPEVAHVSMFTRHHDEYLRRISAFFDQHVGAAA